MFTGIVQGLVTVTEIQHLDDISRLTLDMGPLAEGLVLGASVAVNGTCLTVTACQGSYINFDIIRETLTHTNLGALTKSDLVNVERSFKVGDEIGGHIVSGHVSGVGHLLEQRVQGHDHVIRLGAESDWLQYIFHKGFVAIDGASLTVSAVDRSEGWFEISLIPETIARTTLGHLEEGSQVNVEVEAQTMTTVDTVKTLISDPDWIAQALGEATKAAAD